MEQAGLPNPLPPLGGPVPQGFHLELVGFSKGCVVLNQLLYELAGARAQPGLAAFVEIGSAPRRGRVYISEVAVVL